MYKLDHVNLMTEEKKKFCSQSTYFFFFGTCGLYSIIWNGPLYKWM